MAIDVRSVVDQAEFQAMADKLGIGGGITPGAAVSDATDSEDIVDQFNALLTSLRDAGFIVIAN